MELEELFVEIPGFPNYVVSNYGRVINRHGRDLKYSYYPDGHAKVGLYNGGICRTFQVHQLVAQAFFAEWVPGLEVYHIHSNYDDNSVTNLTLGEYVWRKPWWEEECFRVSGNLICDRCGLPYWKHPYVAKEEAPTLVRACDGRLLKL